MITWFTRNSVAANLLMFTIFFSGIFSLYKFNSLETFPTIETDNVIIKMDLRGATPEDVEKGLTIKIEEAIAGLEGIKEVVSKSQEGTSIVTAEVNSGYDARSILADIKSRIDAVNTFPIESEKAVIELKIRKRDVITVTIASDYSEMETRYYAQNIRDRLLQIQGISQIELTGVRDFEIAIEISQEQLTQYNLTISEIASAIKKSSIDLSAGNLKIEGGDVFVRLKSQAYSIKEFGDIIIKKNLDGSYITLAEIATITDGFEETPLRSRFNGKDAVFMKVYRVGKESAIDVADKVKSFIQQEQSSLPNGYMLRYWDDDSMIVKNRLESLTSNAIQGSILIIILLTLFLRPIIAFWVFVGIPISFMGAFLLMPVFGVTLNVLSLFGFILVLGIVVDDAIVTGENIYTHLKKSTSGEMAAINGTKEISIPVTFGVLTTIAAFIPLAFVEGSRSTLFNQMPYVVIPVLLFSLIESKLILPSHLKYMRLRDEKSSIGKFEHFQQKFADKFEQVILKYYQPFLQLILQNKLTTLLLFISSLVIIATLIVSGWTKFIFFPRIPSETVRVTLTMPTGTPFDLTNKYVMHITQKAELLQKKYQNKKTKESVILNIMTRTGGRGGTSNKGSVSFEITPPEKREISVTSTQLVKEWRKLVGIIPAAQSLTFKAKAGHPTSPIDIQFSGSSLEELQKVAGEVKNHLETYSTVFDITDTLSDGKDELQINLTTKGELLGLNKSDVSLQIRQAIYGAQVQRIQRGRDDIRVMIRLPKTQRSSMANLESMMITTSKGVKISLSDIATLVPSKSPSAITRINGFRTVNIVADVDKQNTNMVIMNQDIKSYLQELMMHYPNVKYTLEGEAREQQETFSSLFYSLIFALFVIYTLLAIPLKSYSQPIVIMGVIPFGIIGAVLGHLIMGLDLTIFSLMGILALMGVVINDALVLVDYINKEHQRTKQLLEAVLSAGAARFRPVMLTSLTTFFGLLPLLFEKSTQAQFLIPMATSLAFGILFATFTTLLLVPVYYIMLAKFKRYINY